MAVSVMAMFTRLTGTSCSAIKLLSVSGFFYVFRVCPSAMDEDHKLSASFTQPFSENTWRAFSLTRTLTSIITPSPSYHHASMRRT